MTIRRKQITKPRRTIINNSEALRHELASRLPDMLSTAIESYERITLPPEEEGDAKSYTALHAAAKAALAHIESLLKLAKWAAIEENKTTPPGNNLQSLITAAKSAVAIEEDGIE